MKKGQMHRISAICIVLMLCAFNTACAQDLTIHPGQLWLDNNGKHINAHGGNIINADGHWYWYGETRAEDGGPMPGVSAYKSDDLVNWTNCGLVLEVLDQPGHMLERGCVIERPKVVYNKNTGKYVMIFHHELKDKGYDAAMAGFAISDTPEGPFSYIRSLRPHAGLWPADWTEVDINAAKALKMDDYKDWWTPEWTEAVKNGLLLNRDFDGGQMSRDMTVYIDDDGKAYHIFSSEDNLTLHIAELTDDFLDYTGKYVRMAPAGHNEAPAIMKRNGKYWMITSGCTGWAPNEARMFWTDSILGPWTQVPTPFKGDKVETSFDSQSTYILELPNGQFIFMADRWQPWQLALSPHIWLPIRYEADGTPVLEWTDSWNLNDLK